MGIRVCFDESVKYTLKDPNNQLDWNKLAGFSRGWHQWNSVRMVWRWNPSLNKVELGRYEYKEGIRIYDTIGEINPGEWFIYDLTINERVGLPRWGYFLQPYFGGDEKSPQKITFRLKII